MFNGLLKKKDETKNISKEEIEYKVNLAKKKIKVELRKQNISMTKARVVFVLDHSYSFKWAYKDGTIQNITERLFPISLEMDDDGKMDFMIFDDDYKNLEAVSMKNIYGYVKNIVKKIGSYGGTVYSPVMNAIVEKYGKKYKSDIPTFVIFITDGDNGDKGDTKKSIIEASKYNIFWKFIGVGNSNFKFLKKLDDISGRVVDNADFITIADLNSISDDTLYNRLFNEYNDWLTACRQKGILK